MKRGFSIIIMLCLLYFSAFSQEMTIDTTDASFQLGKQIGSWIPVTIILIVAILFIRHTYKFRNSEGNID